MNNKIPKYIIEIIQKLEEKGFDGFVVGGCVRDLLLDKTPKDWDIATNAKPEEIQKIFPDSVYENQFGTVGIKVNSAKYKVQSEGKNSKIQTPPSLRNTSPSKGKDDLVEIVEITTYRIESKYSDKRHPDEVKFAKTLEEDLSRRDFTINAMALKLKVQSEKLKATVKN